MFVLRLVPTPGTPDPIRSLRALLELALRRLRCTAVEELAESGAKSSEGG